MSGATDHGTYGDPGMGNSPWGPRPGWNPPSWGYWHWRMLPNPLCVAAVVLGSIFWWPVGLALVFYAIWSKRMGCWGRYGHGGYQGGPWHGGPWQGGAWQNGPGQNGPAQNGPAPWAGWKIWCGGGGQRPAPSSGNRAFDEYRMETLRRLEEEQKEFGAFLDRLRFAKDKAEFDQFMTELRQRPAPPPEQPQPPTAQG